MKSGQDSAAEVLFVRSANDAFRNSQAQSEQKLIDLQLKFDNQSRENIQNVADASSRIGALESELRGACAANLVLTDAARVPQVLTDRD